MEDRDEAQTESARKGKSNTKHKIFVSYNSIKLGENGKCKITNISLKLSSAQYWLQERHLEVNRVRDGNVREA